MTDDRLIRSLRALDAEPVPVTPAPAFADALFSDLLRERDRRRPSRTLVLLVAAVLLLVATGVALVVGARLLQAPPPLVLPRWSVSVQPERDAVAGITADDRGFLAVGFHPDEDAGTTAPRLWTSPDGRTWGPAPGLDGMADLRAAYRAADGSLIVVSGTLDDWQRGWRSVDGSGWVATELHTGTSQPIVAGGPGGYTMVHDPHSGVPGEGPWWSPDGLAWTSLDADGSLRSGWTPERVADESAPAAVGWNPVSAAAAPDGSVVVIVCEAPVSEGRADVWGNACRSASSSDRVTWRFSEPLPFQVQVARYGDAWISAGLTRDKSAIRILRSNDGVTWTPQADLSDRIAPFGGPGPSNSAVVERLLVAGDRLLLRTGPAYTRSFLSRDGIRWQPTGLDQTVVAGMVTGPNGTVVVIGNDFGDTAELWRLEED